MSDLLSASSLLMAIAAILFSLWYAEISKALEITPRTHREDNAAARSTVTAVLITKAIPVACMALAVALIFLPDAIKLARESLHVYQDLGYTAFKKYDAVRTAYCFVTILSLALAIYMLALVGKLWNLRRKLS